MSSKVNEVFLINDCCLRLWHINISEGNDWFNKKSLVNCSLWMTLQGLCFTLRRSAITGGFTPTWALLSWNSWQGLHTYSLAPKSSCQRNDIVNNLPFSEKLNSLIFWGRPGNSGGTWEPSSKKFFSKLHNVFLKGAFCIRFQDSWELFPGMFNKGVLKSKTSDSWDPGFHKFVVK